jgi:putative molybdopterin biosynthesis protein
MTRSSASFHWSIACKLSSGLTCHRLEHTLLEVLESVQQTGSIGKAAKHLGRSYRHVWGELKHWESELNTSLIIWGRTGKGSELTPQAIEFLLAISKTQVELEPQVAHIKNRFEQCVTVLKNIPAPQHAQDNELFVVNFQQTEAA